MLMRGTVVNFRQFAVCIIQVTVTLLVIAQPFDSELTNGKRKGFQALPPSFVTAAAKEVAGAASLEPITIILEAISVSFTTAIAAGAAAKLAYTRGH